MVVPRGQIPLFAERLELGNSCSTCSLFHLAEKPREICTLGMEQLLGQDTEQAGQAQKRGRLRPQICTFQEVFRRFRGGSLRLLNCWSAPVNGVIAAHSKPRVIPLPMIRAAVAAAGRLVASGPLRPLESSVGYQPLRRCFSEMAIVIMCRWKPLRIPVNTDTDAFAVE